MKGKYICIRNKVCVHVCVCLVCMCVPVCLVCLHTHPHKYMCMHVFLCINTDKCSIIFPVHTRTWYLPGCNQLPVSHISIIVQVARISSDI